MKRAAAVVALAACVSCGRAPEVREILLVTLDTTRADRIGCYGHAAAETRTLDALALESTLFENAVSPVPVTLPSHATILTGLYPYHHGVRYNAIHVLPEERNTLAETLKGAGWKTGAVASSFTVAKRFGLGQGFDAYDDFFEGAGAGSLSRDAERVAKDAVDAAIRWWESARGGKRFLWLHLYDPHYRYSPPFPYSIRFADRPYEGEIAYMDAELARLFDLLRKAGEWDSTLVVVAGDHGEGLYEHGERGHAELVYETTLHVPLLVKAPGQREGRRIAEPVGLADLTPTVLEFAGLPVPAGLDGISLRDAVFRGTVPPARALYFEAMGGHINYGWSPLLGVRRGALKYFEGGREEMYDLAADPGEKANLADRAREKASALAAELEGFRKAAEESGASEEAQVLDEQSLAALASLGYVAGPVAGGGRSDRGPHPPDLVSLQQEITASMDAVAAEEWGFAAEALDFILAKDPTNKFALYQRAIVFLRTGDGGQALNVAEGLARVYPDSPDAQDLVGYVLAQVGRPGEAAEVYRKALEKHPGDPRLRYRRVLSLMEARKTAEAAVEVSRLESDRPKDYTTSLTRAMVAATEGRPRDALEALARSVDLGLTDFEAVERSPWFAEVRKDAAYGALKARAAAGRR